MYLKNKEELLNFFKNLKLIGNGSQGICYLDVNTNIVYKIFHQAIDDCDFKINYKKGELLKFSNIKNKTFKWPCDVIDVNNEIVGYINYFVKAKPLYSVRPIKININKFINCINLVKKDIEIISEKGIITYDLMYNILYGDKFYVTDCDEFNYTNKSIQDLINFNNYNFNYELYSFLIDGYLDEFISNYSILSKMYKNKDEDIVYFIEKLVKYLSESVGKEIKTLNDASSCFNKREKELVYYRMI